MYQDEIVMNRIEQERRTVRFMIELYCRKKEERIRGFAANARCIAIITP